ncbi:YdeI/OmpD-associated family protein [Spirosoma sp. KUDC1026]|uniref:YdeI/OmpD-associated family protein n=1 Tax=Spirosoma sp. KUDC1026 TaxID=2745947 RepID=UPI00159BE065|nr:YdeI/OmpD-associated family protein [Spirosoma sp. KUDC1026]QKZ13705.1 YdeI/OmpD-associated family protein [Spirosoma sp. KUDC1026]
MHPDNQLLTFNAQIDIIGVNPFVTVPDDVLAELCRQAGKTRGAIPICGALNGKPYTQTLVRFKGAWRLYINTLMLKNSPRRIGEVVVLTIAHDPVDRTITAPPAWLAALDKAPEAKAVFNKLSPSMQKEIVRYLAKLKSEERLAENIEKAIGFLLGKNRFVGRDRP